MASKDRKQRLKDETRSNILDAAFKIVKEEGWQALSMRKIADVIEYTAPVIYDYFSNKEGLLLELTRKGYCMLTKEIQIAKDQHMLPAKQLEAMWLSYWHFAFAEKELYQVMFGVEMNCCELQKTFTESEMPYNLFATVIAEMIGSQNAIEDEVCRHYYTFWSVIHGLVSINMVRKGNTDELNHQILLDAIKGIIISMKQ